MLISEETIPAVQGKKPLVLHFPYFSLISLQTKTKF